MTVTLILECVCFVFCYEDTLRLLSEEAVISEMCGVSPLLQGKMVKAVICWEWPLSSCSRSPV